MASVSWARSPHMVPPCHSHSRVNGESRPKPIQREGEQPQVRGRANAGSTLGRSPYWTVGEPLPLFEPPILSWKMGRVPHIARGADEHVKTAGTQ